MAISTIARFNGYSYIYDVKYINDEIINESKKRFNALQQKGVIKNQLYNDTIWAITDEVYTCSIDFSIDETEYAKQCKEIFNCSAKHFHNAMRVLITSYFGSDVKALQKIANVGRKLVGLVGGKVNLDELSEYLSVLSDLLSLLPGESIQYDKLIDDIEYSIEQQKNTLDFITKQRKLANYQTYFRFDYILTDFWREASDDDKLLYFPIYLWWKLTAILPLRPIEYVLTPRNCINDNMMTIRRTKLKGKFLSSLYSIKEDYEMLSYKVTDELVKEISWYIENTKTEYKSDIDTLFSKNTQFRLARIRIKAEGHYSYNNLQQCLNSFYENVISGKYSFSVIGKDEKVSLSDYEIEKINLGDTRHIAMISLIASGGSPIICKELAGHDSIQMSANYYSNIKNFLDVLSFERYRMGSHIPLESGLHQELEMSNLTDVLNGYCISPRLKKGDFSDCKSAISFDGNMLDCISCKYLIPNKTNVNAEKELRTAYDLLKYAVEQARRGLGFEESITSSLLKLKAASAMYENNEILKRHMEVQKNVFQEKKNG